MSKLGVEWRKDLEYIELDLNGYGWMYVCMMVMDVWSAWRGVGIAVRLDWLAFFQSYRVVSGANQLILSGYDVAS